MSLIYHAEDDADIAELVAMAFARAGHDVASFTTGADAYAACQEGAPDLLIIDGGHTLDGLDAIKALRADERLSTVPVIVLSGHASSNDVEAGFAAGADDYVTKPFSLRALVDRAAQLIASSGAGVTTDLITGLSATLGSIPMALQL